MSNRTEFITLRNGDAVSLESIPNLSPDVFRETLLQLVRDGCRISSLFGVKTGDGNATEIYTVLSDDERGILVSFKTLIESGSFQSLTPDCPQAHLFEREIAEQFELHPEGHPWLKPVRYPGKDTIPGSGNFYRVEGDSIHEVAVGPVHAGVIEPGHFRFQCHGEEVLHLEIALGYQHRDVESAMTGPMSGRHLHLAENLAGDTAIGHALAYCRQIESLSNTAKSGRAQSLRAIALELERLANHIGDLGAMAADVGFLPTSAFCGRIRGDFLNMSALLCGNRFGRGMLRIGGVRFDMQAERADKLMQMLQKGERDTTIAVELLFDTTSVMARFDGKGTLTAEKAASLGLVGPAARASGLVRDIRHDHPFGLYRFAQLPVSSWKSGDIFARAYVRWLEIRHSINFIREMINALPPGKAYEPAQQKPLQPEHLVVSLVEGWRGEICHVALTDAKGNLRRYKITDPSFHNWIGLAIAMRGQQISDFPLCNKSFNLSYCGHDL